MSKLSRRKLITTGLAATGGVLGLGVAARLAPFTAPDGTLAVPGRSLLASASA